MIIWKYELQLTDRQTVVMPIGSEILSVDNQRGSLCLWAMADPEQPEQNRNIEIIGTGNPMLDGRREFIGTVVMNPFVWHVFEFFV